MYVDSFCEHRRVVYKISTTIPNSYQCLTTDCTYNEFMCVREGFEVFRVNSPNQSPFLSIRTESNHWHSISNSNLPDIQFKPFVTPSKGHCILYQTPRSIKQPLIVLLHGGPHNLFAACFNTDILFYLHHEYIVLVPNYHGSAGYGDDYLHSLCGHIAELELNDVMEAIEYLRTEHSSEIDFERVFVMGSSYGGFIGLNLLIQQSVFKVCSIITNYQ